MVEQTYISLLRGINVSGHKLIKMEHLRGAFEDLGFKDVRTYIQSGNVVFKSQDSATTKIKNKIETGLNRIFDIEVAVVLRNKSELKKIIENNPFLKQKKAQPEKMHVTFLSDKPEKNALHGLITSIGAKSADKLECMGKELFLYCPNGYGRTKLTNSFLERTLRVCATTRNWQSVNKLYEMVACE